MSGQICFNCEGLIDLNVSHNCIKGLTENINRLHFNMNKLMVKKLDHLDGLKYSLEIINQVEQHYIAMGMEQESKHVINTIRNRIRILLGLPYHEG